MFWGNWRHFRCFFCVFFNNQSLSMCGGPKGFAENPSLAYFKNPSLNSRQNMPDNILAIPN